MHRSGTSVVTRAVNLLGPYLGEERGLMLPKEGDNPNGFWENMAVYAFHERLERFLHRCWYNVHPLPQDWWHDPGVSPYRRELAEIVEKEFGGHPLWAWKDPRTALFLPLWQEILRDLGVEIGYVICLRNPVDVAASLHKRNGLPKDRSLVLWLQHMLHACYYTAGSRRIVTSYDTLLADWERALKGISEALSIPWPADDKPLRDGMSSFLNPRLRHSRSDMEAMKDNREIPEEIRRLYSLLLEAIESPELTGASDFDDSVGDLYREYPSVASSLFSSAKKTKGQRGSAVSRQESPEAVRPNTSASAHDSVSGKVRASIIIPVFNQVEYTRKCVEAIRGNTRQALYEIIVVDNASTDETAEYLRGLGAAVTVVSNPDNRGFAAACNQGARAAAAGYLVFLNNDTIVAPDLLEDRKSVV